MRKRLQQLLVPLDRMEVVEHYGAGGVARVRDVDMWLPLVSFQVSQSSDRPKGVARLGLERGCPAHGRESTRFW